MPKTRTFGTATSPGHRRTIMLVPFLILLVDQLSKTIIMQWLGPQADRHRWEIAGEYLAFEYLENRGAAFGIMTGHTGLLTGLSIGIAAVGIALMWQQATQHAVTAVAIGMIVGGALGNIIDRIRLGYVVDFVAIGIWPKFNLADSSITVGVLSLLWSAFAAERDASHAQSGAAMNE